MYPSNSRRYNSLTFCCAMVSRRLPSYTYEEPVTPIPDPVRFFLRSRRTISRNKITRPSSCFSMASNLCGRTRQSGTETMVKAPSGWATLRAPWLNFSERWNSTHVTRTTSFELGEVFLNQNSPAAAEALPRPPLRSFPNSAYIWFGLGVAYLAEGRYSSAEAALRKSLETDPHLDLAYVVFSPAATTKPATGTGSARQRSGSSGVAPRNYAGYYYEALSWLRGSPASARSDREAERLLRKAADLSDSEPEADYELAKLLAKQGKKDASRLELEKIVRQNPDFGPAHYQLSRLYREKGELAKSGEEQPRVLTASAPKRG